MRLQALFFVSHSGDISVKARPLHGAQRMRIYERDGKRCVLCMVPLKLFRCQVGFLDDCMLAHVDHILPRARGGQNNHENLRLLCERCNESLGAAL